MVIVTMMVVTTTMMIMTTTMMMIVATTKRMVTTTVTMTMKDHRNVKSKQPCGHAETDRETDMQRQMQSREADSPR